MQELHNVIVNGMLIAHQTQKVRTISMRVLLPSLTAHTCFRNGAVSRVSSSYTYIYNAQTMQSTISVSTQSQPLHQLVCTIAIPAIYNTKEKYGFISALSDKLW